MDEPIDEVRVLAVAEQEIPAGALVRVKLLDVSRADAPSQQMSSRVVQHQGGHLQPVELAVPAVAGNVRLVVQVHVDRDGSGDISPGDWLTTQAYPVAPGTTMTVQLTAI